MGTSSIEVGMQITTISGDLFDSSLELEKSKKVDELVISLGYYFFQHF